jgi:hypothetical protein
MTAEPLEVSPWRARMNRWRWRWTHAMGWPGLGGVLLCVCAAVLAWGARPAISRSQAEMLRAHVARLDAASRQAPTASNVAARDPRDAVRDTFPSLVQRGRVIGDLLVLLGKAGVAADEADYTPEELEPDLVRLRIVMPVNGGYLPMRKLVADILNEMPFAALDSLDLERPAASGQILHGHLRLSLFFRRESP